MNTPDTVSHAKQIPLTDRLDNTAEAAKAKAIYNGMRAAGYDNLTAIHSLCLAVAMLTSPDKTTRETAKRRIRELAAKGKTGA